MQPIRISAFSGIAPKVAPRLLPDTMAQAADNCRLLSGELEAWKATKLVTNSSKGAGVKSIHRMVDAGGNDVWLNWLEDVDAVRGAIAGDKTQRTYYTGYGEPRVTDLALATAGTDYPQSCYVLGVYPPVTAPTVSHSGGTGASIQRAFVYTFVTEWGEESQPSPASPTVTGKVDGTWSLTGMNGAWENTFAVTGGSWAGGTATLQVASTFGLRVGETIKVSGVTPSGYNVPRAKITALTSTSISYALGSNPGAYSSGGSITRDAPHHTSGLKKRIYWTETVSGETVFQFVSEIDGTLTSTTVAGNATVGEPIPSSNYAMPPVDMSGLVAMPNGMMAGFAGNELCFCEPFQPHAWPERYRLTAAHEIVGLGTFENSVVVCTNGKPIVATGSHPSSMSEIQISGSWPCVSKRGIVSTREGVIYPSKDGFILISPSGSGEASAGVLSRKEFQHYAPETMFAAVFQGRYFCWYTDSNGVVKGLIFDRTGQAAMLVPIMVQASAAWSDPATGELYIVVSGKIRQWDADEENVLSFDWKSKKLVLSSPKNYSAAKVVADYDALDYVPPPQETDNEEYTYNVALLAQSETHPGQGKTAGCMNEAMLGDTYELNGSLLKHGAKRAGEVEAADRFLTFVLYADGKQVFSKDMTSSRPFRLPAGYKATEIEVRLMGNIKVHYAELAGSVQGLAQV